MTAGAGHVAVLRHVLEIAAENVRTGGRPFATIITRDSEIVGTGVNAVVATRDPTAHAEVLAIRAACERLSRADLSDCTLYTVSEPCPMCMGALLWANIKAVYFAVTKDVSAACGFTDFYPEFAKPFAERSVPMRQIPIGSARDVLESGRVTTPVSHPPGESPVS